MTDLARSTTSPPAETTTPLVGLIEVSKRFPGVLALDSVSLTINAGEVHVLLGENGAGKSTIVGLLSGLQEPDGGHLTVDGKPVRLANPGDSLAAGISTVFQHVMLVPTLTVFENLVLGDKWWRAPPRAEIERRLAVLAESFDLKIPLDAITGELSLGEQQQIEIARALLRKSRVVILDEATSMLTPRGTEELGGRIRRLAEQGLAVIFITHKLSEAYRFGDRISVLKQGRLAGSIAPDELRSVDEATAIEHIVRLMFGGADTEGAAQPKKRDTAHGDVRLAIVGVSTEGGRDVVALKDIAFEVRSGEILGIAGIDGNGQKQLADALAGQRALASGQILLDGIDLTDVSVGGRRQRGLRYLTDDRLAEGTVSEFPVSENTVIKEIGAPPFWTAGIERPARIAQHARDLIEKFSVRTPSETTPIGHLSGGNIQKVLLGRELSGAARVVVFNKPTYGLDVQNTKVSRQRIAEIAANGMGVVLISTELDELIQLADSIVVMVRGKIRGTIRNEGPAEELRLQIGRLMVVDEATEKAA